MPPFPRRSELRATMSLAFGRVMVGAYARAGSPAARVINFRPLDDPYPEYERLRAAVRFACCAGWRACRWTPALRACEHFAVL